MHTFRHVALAATLAITGIVGGLMPSAGQVALDFEPDYFKSDLTSLEVEVEGENFVIDEVFQQNYPNGENEQVYIHSDYANLQITFLDDEDAPEDTIDLWISNLSDDMDSLEVVENGEEDDVVWYYAEGEYQDDTFVYYIQVTEDVQDNVDMLESVLTLDGSLIDAMDAGQQEITVDGEGFMDNVDLDELRELTGDEPSRDGAVDDGEDDPDATQEAGRS
jgi:hypothetical protein